MSKSANQKLKILYLLRALEEKTDETHPISMPDILNYLEGYGISAERKSIYDDMEILRLYGIDIVATKGRSCGYYIGSRQFELAELKLLVDAVQSSKFLTTKKSGSLIKKLENLCSENDGKTLQRQVYVADRIKTMNESIYYNVDDIHSAISANKMIEFLYCEWNTSKELVPRKNGELYCVSPWALVWDDENYYLVAYDHKAEMVKHYRVDKIKNINTVDEKRQGNEYFQNFDKGGFSKKTFGMFAGEESYVTLECQDKYIGVILDRFGKDIQIRNGKNGKFTTSVKVNVSSQFFGWITGIGGGIVIISPDKVVSDYREYLNAILSKY